jgi:HK97 family phage portal protein
VFHFEEDLQEDDFETVRNRVMERYAGADNAGTIGVTAGSKLDIKEIGTNNKDMDFAVLQAMAKQAVALTYKVPLPLISTDATSFNNYREAKLALYDDAVLPLADRIFGGLTQLLMPRYGEDPAKTQITFDMDQITALAVRRNEELKLRKALNLESDNELRAMIGREPYKGGDQFLKPANLIPVGVDLFTEPTVSLARDGDDDA